MLKNHPMHLLLQGWTIIILYNQEVYKMQLKENAAVRLLMIIKKRDHISAILNDIHWLSVRSRMKFKTVLLTYKL